jgi:streptogramin lyase
MLLSGVFLLALSIVAAAPAQAATGYRTQPAVTGTGMFAYGTQRTLIGTGLVYPPSVAVDSAGDVFVADPDNGRVVEMTPAGVQSNVPVTGLIDPYGVALDAAGDLFILDNIAQAIIELSHTGVQTTRSIAGA